MKTNQKISVETEPHHGFTLIELLVVVAIVVLLAALAAPTFAHTTRQSLQAQCAGNLRQFALALHIYGGENRDRLPAPSSGYWPWDINTGPADAIVSYGAPRSVMYCPANPGQNVDPLWNYGIGIRVIGYAMSFMNTGGLFVTNVNTQLTPKPAIFGPGLLPSRPASERVLIADATISQPGQNNPAARTSYNYVRIQGSFVTPHRTAHLDNSYPIGGNVAMMDAHVEWRPFEQMVPRMDSSSINPVFWW
jgi:prepilin-type N-terminal cleavage/methylation domain-containing protein